MIKLGMGGTVGGNGAGWRTVAGAGAGAGAGPEPAAAAAAAEIQSLRESLRVAEEVGVLTRTW